MVFYLRRIKEYLQLCLFSFQSQRKAMPKNIQPTAKIAHISHTSKVMLKILRARLQQYMNHELPDVRAGFRKGRGTRNQIANTCCIIEKAKKSSQKTSISAILTVPKPLTVWITTNWKIFQEMGLPDHLTYLLRNLYGGQEATVRTGHEITRPVPNQERNMSRLYIVILLI